MAEKLTESTWTSFAKKRELDDAAFVKALARLDKTADADHDGRLQALADVAEQAKKLVAALPKRKPPLADKEAKEVKDKLTALQAEAERLQKDTKTAQAAAAAEGDDDEDSPALLTTKLVPLLRALRKPEVQMHALIGTVGKESAVLIMRKAISPARRKLVAEYLDAKGAAKYVTGQCLFEKEAVTFVVEGSAGGLAKRLRVALLNQTGLRVKVRVRGEDGVEDEDGEDEAESEGAGDAAMAVPEAPPLPTAADAPPAAPSAEALAYAQRRSTLEQASNLALQKQHPESTKIRALLAFAGEKADGQKDYAAALKALGLLEALLKAPAAAAAAAPAPAAGTGAKTIAPAIVYTQTRLAWGATRKKIQAELQKLEKAILESYQGNAVLPQVTQGVRKLDGVLAMFDESLNDTLDSALNATDPAAKQGFHDEARAIIARYQGFLASDPIVKELDANPFVPITVQATLTSTLSTLASKIV